MVTKLEKLFYEKRKNVFTRRKSSAPFTVAKPTSECYGPLKSHSALTALTKTTNTRNIDFLEKRYSLVHPIAEKQAAPLPLLHHTIVKLLEL